MSVIADIRVPSLAFELGRILALDPGDRVSLESMVPLGQTAVPFFWVGDDIRDSFEPEMVDHPSVDEVEVIETHDNRTLYAIQWAVERDLFFEALNSHHAQVLNAKGTDENWEFELRFPSHDALSTFGEECENARIDIDIQHIYNPTKPGAGPWYGLTAVQRETLVRAVEGGYYSLPRGISTAELADELDISDQAVTERLRRGIATLVEHTLIASQNLEAE